VLLSLPFCVVAVEGKVIVLAVIPVILPLASTVTCGVINEFPNDNDLFPVSPTVAAETMVDKVTGIDTFAEPSKDWAVPVASPETLNVRAVANFVAVATLLGNA
jgi:hypothetical protein